MKICVVKTLSDNDNAHCESRSNDNNNVCCENKSNGNNNVLAAKICIVKTKVVITKFFVAKVLVVIAETFVVKVLGVITTSNITAKIFATDVIATDCNNSFLVGKSNFCSNIKYLPTKNVAANSLFFL